MSPKVLDCTLRDGGYYVDWDFDEEFVRKYLAAMVAAKIDVVEIGFRFLPTNKFLGAFAYSTDEYLTSIDLPSEMAIAVMVNAYELIEYGVDKAIKQLFTNKEKSPVDIVRIAVCAKDISQSQDIVQRLDDLGYRVFLNLMQIDSIEKSQLISIVEQISSWNIVEVLYFADSFGSMEPDVVKSIVCIIQKGWRGPLGIHAHDNKGLALINSLTAQEAGVQYFDSTLCGMGRGAGNTKTEYLLVELLQKNSGVFFPDPLFPLVLHELDLLQKKYAWGGNIYYYLSALYGIHPTYIQEMLRDKRYSVEQILSAINFLKSTKAPFFSFENMLRAVTGIEGSEHGAWSADGWLYKRKVLILGAGSGTKKYIEQLKSFIDKHRPFVLCLNINNDVPNEIVDAYVACHETRILMEYEGYANLGKPVIIPLASIPEDIKEAIHRADILDYGLRIDKECFEISSNGCVLTSPLALTYAIAVVTAGGAEKIFMAGIDGYGRSDSRQVEMVEVLETYKKYPISIPMVAITPTTYPIIQHSIFEDDVEKSI